VVVDAQEMETRMETRIWRHYRRKSRRL